MTPEAWAELWAGPTQAEVDRALAAIARLQAIDAAGQRLAAWRQRHPEATARDPIASLLADLEATYGAA